MNAQTDTAGTTIIVEFSEIMESVIELAAFSITVNSSEVSITDAAFDGSDASVLIFTLENSVEYSDDILISYSEGDYRSAEGYKLLSFTKYVRNTVPNPNPDVLGKRNYAHEVNAFPNPFDQQLTFENTNQIQSILLYNAEGKLIGSYQVNGRNIVIVDTSVFPDGLLVARLLDRNHNTVGTIRLLKE
jgi:hypothetical protein